MKPKPCPFGCKEGEGEVIYTNRSWYVRCSVCHSTRRQRGAGFATKHYAIRAWNRREGVRDE